MLYISTIKQKQILTKNKNKMKEAKYITILDFNTGLVHQLSIKDWDLDNESCKEFISRIGFNSDNCQWMVHEVGGVQSTNI